MKKYIGYITAIYVGGQVITPCLIHADSMDEANAKAIRDAMLRWPRSKGYLFHNCDFILLPEEATDDKSK